jgi:hypothetical protein
MTVIPGAAAQTVIPGAAVAAMARDPIMFLPELAERDAEGEIAAIYAEIRRLGGVPMVALIFRHLATRPRVLEWMWNAVGPAWRSGRLQEAAWRVAREAPLEPIARVSRAALRAWGVDDAGEHEIHDVLIAYNRANPENMLTMLCVLRLLEINWGTTPINLIQQSPWSPPAAPAIVPMADITKLPREVLDVLDLVAAPGERGGPRVVQSLYRHFCHRPAFLAAVVTMLRARFDDGTIDGAVASIHAAMSSEADAIVASLSAPQPPDRSVEATCARFAGAVIPQMIVVGRLIDEALPASVAAHPAPR